METNNTPIKNTINSLSLNNTPIQSNQIKTPIHTPVNNTNFTKQYQTPNNNLIFSTPIQNSPFLNDLTPVSETKKIFDIDSSDVLPMKSSSNDKNVHSPPKSTITLSEVRSICEKKLLELDINGINEIIKLTKNKKKKVTEWFYNEWLSSNKEIDTGIVLRTIFSVFCNLRNDERINNKVSVEFQLFWNGLKKEKRSRHITKKIKKRVKNKQLDQFEDIGDSFIN